MCPGSDLESRESTLNGDHQNQLLKSYNEETGDGDKFIHGFLRKIQVRQLLSRLPLNETREPLNQASLPPSLALSLSLYHHKHLLCLENRKILNKTSFFLLHFLATCTF
ncbi:hypothetical protein ES319_A10G161500v1 [Gossypium barbadense]|uniref:Uncharacterized protein n=2 Tax=Gossypium TaxID=3633 RepID=A0A5J5U3Z0_GOSBA|nr:hypothetical protein ES319_A10G161500v1 [Gossypium barbadense]TYG99235.1 hypothetical protein ES288_A10G180200v1 [Gossypium darwinii]